MAGQGPFLWLSKTAPPAGFVDIPPGGMCLSAFLFIQRGREILLGKYRDDPRWETLAGLDEDRRRVHGAGWTIPARQLRYGEDPRDAARSIAEDILQIHGMAFSEPRVEVDVYEPRRSPGKLHYDVWFLVDGHAPKGWKPVVPPWYAELAWRDPRATPASEYARGHEDVVARWLEKRAAKA
ncbi:MAG: hypothetical protein A3K65_05655 [Euryarchaeota archaeon RBG_16_68_12]|nr:MAG: hypothetical protein A3K65_05655 [Euryarchaeota archaeon RBG_16_68_12]